MMQLWTPSVAAIINFVAVILNFLAAILNFVAARLNFMVAILGFPISYLKANQLYGHSQLLLGRAVTKCYY